MVATVIIEELNAGGETATNKTSGTVRFKNADDAVVDTNDRLLIPTANREFSFRKMLRLRMTVKPDVDIDNLQAYSDGSKVWETAVQAWYARKSVYAVGTVPTETEFPPQWPSVAAMADLFTATSGSPIDMDGFNPGPYTSSGQMGDYLGLVMSVGQSATQGTLTAETLTFAFDET